ncbi:MAG: hypothetical protein L0027_15180 [Candidatus Rokubacteria bacterium]|nr:hypothetical protein [Candidatus Rokubacteria bacterium]
MAGDGIVPGGLGLFRKLTRPEPQSLAVAGSFEMSLPQHFSTFLCRVVDAAGADVVPSTARVRVGIGALDDGANLASGQAPVLATLRDVIDPVAFPVFWISRTDTRKLYVHVLAVQAGTFLEVTGIEGGAFPRQPTAAEIAAAIAAPASGGGPAPYVWSAPAAVPMGAASAVILAANTGRRAFRIQNTGGVSVFFRKLASPAVVASDIELLPDDVYEEGEGRTLYTGEIRGITAGAAGELRVEEAT